MAGRIRSIKPELIATERFASLSDPAARLFVGCYSLVDDLGNCPAGPRFLQGQIFYARPKSLIAIGKHLAELELARLVDLYEVDRAQYLAIIGWAEKQAPTHQRIDKPQGARFPPPRSVRSWNEFSPHSETDRDRDSDRESTATATSTLSVATPPSPPLAPVALEAPARGPRTTRAIRDRIASGDLDGAACDASIAKFDDRHAARGTVFATDAQRDAECAKWIRGEHALRERKPRAWAPTESKPSIPDSVDVPAGSWMIVDAKDPRSLLLYEGREFQEAQLRAHWNLEADDIVSVEVDGRPAFVSIVDDEAMGAA